MRQSEVEPVMVIIRMISHNGETCGIGRELNASPIYF
jgi:hypothetical protein